MCRGTFVQKVLLFVLFLGKMLLDNRRKVVIHYNIEAAIKEIAKGAIRLSYAETSRRLTYA